MKKSFGYKRCLAVITAITLAVSSLTGCGNVQVADSDMYITPEEAASVENTNASGNDLPMEEPKTQYQNSVTDQEYQKGIYNLPLDYVFEFPCSEEAGAVFYDAFRVYATADYENAYSTFNENSYEDGVIRVAPGSVTYLDDDKSREVEDGTWGSMNQLFLVQFLDLQTGRELAHPIITPFSVEHSMKAPVIAQGADEKNNYTLSWKPVEGANKYLVYELLDETAFVLCCSTTDTTVSVEEFAGQKEMENLTQLFWNDMGMEDEGVGDSGITVMNAAVRYNEITNDGRFAVVAVGDNDRSGISNIVDVREISASLPYTIPEGVLEVEIQSILDAPAYVDVEMVDGSYAKMVIDYHGAPAYKDPSDPKKIIVRVHVANTIFDSFLVCMTGMDYDEVIRQKQAILDRQDALLATVQPADIAATVLEVTRDIPILTPVEELMQEVVPKVENNLELLGRERVEKVLYAESDLEKWLAYCLIAQMDVIPVPIATYPESANLEYLFDVFLEAYRQNPTCGIIDIGNVQYNDEYEALVIPYVEASLTRLEKTGEELEKAEEVAATVCNDGMSDYEKVFALNEYFRINATYDYDSKATNVNLSTLSEAFIDAHTPYGILCNNYGVCESYSEAFILTSRMAGLESIAEMGSIFGGGHEWNRVKIDGSWCVLDVTNNDNNDYYVNGLLNLSDDQSHGILVPSKQALVDPDRFRASTEFNEYYYVSGMSASDLDEAKTLLTEALSKEDHATVRLPLGSTEDDARRLLQGMIFDGVSIRNGGFCFGLIYVEK